VVTFGLPDLGRSLTVAVSVKRLAKLDIVGCVHPSCLATARWFMPASSIPMALARCSGVNRGICFFFLYSQPEVSREPPDSI